MNIFLIIPVFAGWITGLLVNYLADVLPRTRTFSRPVCHRCGKELTTLDYVLFRPCSEGHHRSVRTWATQLVGVIINIYIWIDAPEKLGYFPALFLTTYFMLVFIIDLENRLILHPTSIVGAVIGLITGILLHGVKATLLGGAAGLGIMLSLYFMGVLFTKFRARRMQAAGQEPDDEEALGAGDVILVTILGLILGWPLIWFGLLFGILLGGIVSLLLVVWLVASRQYGKNALMLFIPYGPYFIVSAYLIVFLPKWVAMLVPD